jgi:hypothetical protein
VHANESPPCLPLRSGAAFAFMLVPRVEPWMDFANTTDLDSARLERLYTRHTWPYRHDRLTVRVRYSRGAAFSARATTPREHLRNLAGVTLSVRG